MITTQNGRVNLTGTTYGLHINISDESEEAIVRPLMNPAHKKIEVAVRYHDVVKEFTLAGFFRRLGFYDEKKT